jgi:hypothetical protein
MKFYGVDAQAKIRAAEARIFTEFAFRPHVYVGPTDLEWDIRGRIKSMFKQYFRAREQDELLDNVLKKILRQIWLYWTVVPAFHQIAITSFAELRTFLFSLPGEHGWQDGDEYIRLLAAE